MKSHKLKYHTCPHCQKQATVLVEIEDKRHFYRDTEGNVQYHCTSCNTTFSIDTNGNVISTLLRC